MTVDDDVSQIPGQLCDEGGDRVLPVRRGVGRRNDDQLRYVRRMRCRAFDDGTVQREVVRCRAEPGLRLLADHVDDAVTHVRQLMQSAPGDVARDEAYSLSLAPGGDEAEQAEAEERRFQLGGRNRSDAGRPLVRERGDGLVGLLENVEEPGAAPQRHTQYGGANGRQVHGPREVLGGRRAHRPLVSACPGPRCLGNGELVVGRGRGGHVGGLPNQVVQCPMPDGGDPLARHFATVSAPRTGGAVTVCHPGGFTTEDTDPPGAGRLQSPRRAPRSGALMSPVPGVPSASP